MTCILLLSTKGLIWQCARFHRCTCLLGWEINKGTTRIASCCSPKHIIFSCQKRKESRRNFSRDRHYELASLLPIQLQKKIDKTDWGEILCHNKQRHARRRPQILLKRFSFQKSESVCDITVFIFKLVFNCRNRI